MLINRNIVALFALPFMASATASELSIGAGAAYNESPYRGYNENTKAIPLISYEGDTFYVRQTTLGFILSQSEKNELSLTASWMPLEFDPTDNDDYAMQQLDKRDSTAMAGVAWYHHERWGTVKASAAADVLDNSNGWVGELSVFHKMQIGRLSLTPALGVSIMTRISVTITMAFQRVSPVVAVWQVIPRRMPGCLCQPDGKIPDRRARRIDGERRIQRAAGRDYRQPDD